MGRKKEGEGGRREEGQDGPGLFRHCSGGLQHGLAREGDRPLFTRIKLRRKDVTCPNQRAARGKLGLNRRGNCLNGSHVTDL
jgi:hypothetical protein